MSDMSDYADKQRKEAESDRKAMTDSVTTESKVITERLNVTHDELVNLGKQIHAAYKRQKTEDDHFLDQFATKIDELKAKVKEISKKRGSVLETLDGIAKELKKENNDIVKGQVFFHKVGSKVADLHSAGDLDKFMAFMNNGVLKNQSQKAEKRVHTATTKAFHITKRLADLIKYIMDNHLEQTVSLDFQFGIPAESITGFVRKAKEYLEDTIIPRLRKTEHDLTEVEKILRKAESL